jgi:hypothetical protein
VYSRASVASGDADASPATGNAAVHLISRLCNASAEADDIAEALSYAAWRAEEVEVPLAQR